MSGPLVSLHPSLLLRRDATALKLVDASQKLGIAQNTELRDGLRGGAGFGANAGPDGLVAFEVLDEAFQLGDGEVVVSHFVLDLCR